MFVNVLSTDNHQDSTIILSSDTEDGERGDESPSDTPNRNVDKGWSLWGLVRAGWTAKEGASSPTPDSNPIRPDQGNSFFPREQLFVLHNEKLIIENVVFTQQN